MVNEQLQSSHVPLNQVVVYNLTTKKEEWINGKRNILMSYRSFKYINLQLFI